ncbi:MAG TPA: helix-turn-helix domain-containing protein [bacterium]|nr:helix-turn-helix domain-containing protein [bacterium]
MVETERRRLEDFAAEGVDRRLARLLLRLARSFGRNAARGLALDVSLSRPDLAELVISTPYTVSRILADWRRLDIVDAQRERILILDPEAMAALADTASTNRPVPVRSGGKRKGPTPADE